MHICRDGSECVEIPGAGEGDTFFCAARCDCAHPQEGCPRTSYNARPSCSLHGETTGNCWCALLACKTDADCPPNLRCRTINENRMCYP